MTATDHTPIPTLRLSDGADMPILGLGTYRMGEARRRHASELATLRAAIDAGFTLFDTAEMYGDGGSERLLGKAIAGHRDALFVVTKVYPHNAGAKSAVTACERSLRRLGTDRLDLYLLHWRGGVPLGETIDAFERLRHDGKILRWGVSNFDVADLDELAALPEGRRCAVNQVLYCLSERGIEWSLSKTCRRLAIAIMAYSPFREGPLLRDPDLVRIASELRATPAQVAIAWLLQRGAITIPQTSSLAHMREIHAAASLSLSRETLAAIDQAFPPPTRARPLAVI